MAVQAPAVQEFHGKWFAQTLAGNMYIGSSAAAGVVPPVCTATAHVFGLWNPLGSGKLAVLAKLRVGLVTIGVVTSSFSWSALLVAGSQIATAAPITVFTQVAAVNALVSPNAANSSVMRFAPGAATTTATTFLRNIGLSVCNATSPTVANAYWPQMGEDYDGDLIVAPGSAIFLTNNVAGVATYGVSLMWYETPV